MQPGPPISNSSHRGTAYKSVTYILGFFEDRRKVTLNQLARERGVSAPSYMLTLRRATRKLIGASIDRSTSFERNVSN